MARAYTYITKYTSPNQNARNRKIQGITFTGGAVRSGQKLEVIVSWLCDKRAGTSAHYVVSDGTRVLHCCPGQRAWHAGNSSRESYADRYRAGSERVAACIGTYADCCGSDRGSAGHVREPASVASQAVDIYASALATVISRPWIAWTSVAHRHLRVARRACAVEACRPGQLVEVGVSVALHLRRC